MPRVQENVVDYESTGAAGEGRGVAWLGCGRGRVTGRCCYWHSTGRLHRAEAERDRLQRRWDAVIAAMEAGIASVPAESLAATLMRGLVTLIRKLESEP